MVNAVVYSASKERHLKVLSLYRNSPNTVPAKLSYPNQLKLLAVNTSTLAYCVLGTNNSCSISHTYMTLCQLETRKRVTRSNSKSVTKRLAFILTASLLQVPGLISI